MDIGQRLHIGDVLGRAEPLLSEGQVEAEGVAGQPVLVRGERLVELLGLGAADGGVKRRHHTEEAHLVRRGVGEGDQVEAVKTGELGRLVAGLQLRADERVRLVLELDRIRTLLHGRDLRVSGTDSRRQDMDEVGNVKPAGPRSGRWPGVP